MINEIDKNFVEKFFFQVVRAKKRKEERKKEKKVEKEEKKGKEEKPLITRFETPTKLIPSIIPSTLHPTYQVIAMQAPAPAPAAPAVQIQIHEKIDSLLANENISMIECSDGKIKARNSEIFEIEIKEEETREIIRKFSELTKIPLVDNILKATFMNFHITAIISDIMPSRFMIIKKKKEMLFPSS